MDGMSGDTGPECAKRKNSIVMTRLFHDPVYDVPTQAVFARSPPTGSRLGIRRDRTGVHSRDRIEEEGSSYARQRAAEPKEDGGIGAHRKDMEWGTEGKRG